LGEELKKVRAGEPENLRGSNLKILKTRKFEQKTGKLMN